MKLVELLAKELAEWPEGVTHLTQSSVDNEIYNAGSGREEDELSSLSARFDTSVSHSEGSYPIVTRAQWQAERDRQKGGKWKRHRGGDKPKSVSDGEIVEVRLRSGDIQEAQADDFIWNHGDCDESANITKYRIISQPQAEEVEQLTEKKWYEPEEPADTREYKGPFPCSSIGEPVNALEWDIEFPSGVIHLEAQAHQIDGPIKWRDEVTELNAYIDKFTRERDALINRLALEGFALIPAITPVMGVSDDMNFWESWQVGDIIKVTNDHDIEDGQYAILEIEDAGYEGQLPVKTYKGWPDTEYATLEFISRP
jgi:hypothetical protein